MCKRPSGRRPIARRCPDPPVTAGVYVELVGDAGDAIRKPVRERIPCESWKIAGDLVKVLFHNAVRQSRLIAADRGVATLAEFGEQLGARNRLTAEFSSGDCDEAVEGVGCQSIPRHPQAVEV